MSLWHLFHFKHLCAETTMTYSGWIIVLSIFVTSIYKLFDTSSVVDKICALLNWILDHQTILHYWLGVSHPTPKNSHYFIWVVIQLDNLIENWKFSHLVWKTNSGDKSRLFWLNWQITWKCPYTYYLVSLVNYECYLQGVPLWPPHT